MTKIPTREEVENQLQNELKWPAIQDLRRIADMGVDRVELNPASIIMCLDALIASRIAIVKLESENAELKVKLAEADRRVLLAHKYGFADARNFPLMTLEESFTILRTHTSEEGRHESSYHPERKEE